MDLIKKIDIFMNEAGMSDYFVQNQRGWKKAEEAYADGDMFNYMNMVINQAGKKAKYGKWEANEEVMMGTWGWSDGGDDMVYITPFFESNGVSAQWTNYEKDKFSKDIQFKFKPTGNPDKDFKAYMTIVRKVISNGPKY